MATCGSCRKTAMPVSRPPVLLQIRRRYRAQWREMAFTVESNSGDWTLWVRDSTQGQTLYTAHRSGSVAAQNAAAEFAFFSAPGTASGTSISRLARELNWQEYW
jgi:hypothetical protein